MGGKRNSFLLPAACDILAGGDLRSADCALVSPHGRWRVSRDISGGAGAGHHLARARQTAVVSGLQQFDLDAAYLDDLKLELIEVKQLAVDQGGTMLVWTGDKASAVPPASSQEREPLSYTPPHLAEKILTARSDLEGERKQVTVLFADLKGSLELIADRDPEEARQILDPVLEHLMAAVHRYEGTVNQVMGDGIMALFGAPVAHEDHAVRAVTPPWLYRRPCAATARRCVGGTVWRCRAASGSTPETWSCGPSAATCTWTTRPSGRRRTWRRVWNNSPRREHPADRHDPAAGGRAGAGQCLGPIPVKGLAEPVEVFELVGASTVRRRLQASAARGLTRFVGRQYELESLRQALERVGAGHGQVVAAVGEAGVGKSRLVYEFVHSHRTRAGWCWKRLGVLWQGNAVFPGAGPPEALCPCRGARRHRTVRAKVTGQVLTLDETLQDTVPALLALLDALPEDSPFLRDRPSAVSARWWPSSACCCAKARSSPCCSSSKTCTGSMPRRRPSSTAWSRACPRLACCCWLTIARVPARLGQQDVLHPTAT